MTQVPRTVPIHGVANKGAGKLERIGYVEFEPTVGGWEGKGYAYDPVSGEAEWECTFRGTTYGGVLHSCSRRVVEVVEGVAE